MTATSQYGLNFTRIPFFRTALAFRRLSPGVDPTKLLFGPRRSRREAAQRSHDPCASIGRIDDIVDAESGGPIQRLAGLVGARDHLIETGAPLGRVCDGRQLVAVAQLYRALQPHAPELAGWPRDGEHRRLVAAAGHGDGAKAIALPEDHAEQRHRQVRADDEQPRAVAHERRLLDLGADHHTRRVRERQHRQVEGLTDLQEPRGLVRAVGVDRPAQETRIVGEEAKRPPFDADQGGDHRLAELGSQLEHRAFVSEQMYQLADIVDAQPVLRDDAAQPALVDGAPVGERALEVGEILLGETNRVRLVVGEDVDDAVRLLHADRPDLFGAEDAEPAALDHGRSAHADRGVLGGDNDVATAEHRRVAGEAAARGDADHRRRARHAAPELEAADEAATFGVAGPPAAALAEEDGRHAPAGSQLDEAIHLLV